jgi:hypothetical protein
MARGRFITEFERECIRIGKSKDISNATIARALSRTKAAIGQQVKEMEEAGTIADLPMVFIVDDIADMLRTKGTIK